MRTSMIRRLFVIASAVTALPLMAACEAGEASTAHVEQVASAASAATTPFDPSFDHDGGAWVGSWDNMQPKSIAVRADHKIMYS